MYKINLKLEMKEILCAYILNIVGKM